MTRLASLALALTLLAPAAALAQDGFDLRHLVGRHPAAGEKARSVEEQHQVMVQKLGRAGQPGREQKRETSGAQTYLEEVQAVGADGEPTRILRTYERFQGEDGQDVVVTGVKVLLTRGEDHTHAFAAAEGSAPLPPAVQQDLTKDAEQKNQRQAKGLGDDALVQALFPAAAVAEKGTWTVDPLGAARCLGLEAEDLDAGASSATGVVDGTEDRAGKRWLKTTVKLVLAIKRMNGVDLPTPANLELTLGFALPVAGDTPDLEVTMTQHFVAALPTPPNAPPGMSMNLSMDSTRAETKTAVD